MDPDSINQLFGQQPDTRQEPQSYTPLPDNIANSSGPKKKSRKAIYFGLIAILIVVLGVIIYQIVQTTLTQRQTSSVKALEFCGQAIPYPFDTPACPQQGQLPANCCKKKSPVCYECRHNSGQIQLYGCCNISTPTSPPPPTSPPQPTSTPVPQPTSTPVPKPTATPLPTSTPPAQPTSTPPPQPTSTPAPSVCPVPGNIANIEVICPICTSD